MTALRWLREEWPSALQVVGIVLVAVGTAVAFGYGVGLMVGGAGITAYGIAEERG